MEKNKLSLIVIVALALSLSSFAIANAHFNFYVISEWSMESAQPNEITIIWGHPYEGIYFDPPKIADIGLIKPDGTKVNLSLEEITVQGIEGSAVGYRTSFTPDMRGDYIIYTDFYPEIVEEEEIVWEDHVKAIIHYKTTTGWDQSTGQLIEIIPLTRPYGMEEGFVFVGQAIYNGQPLANAPVEIEKYYPVGSCPEPLPEEPLVTRETRTDVNGMFSYTLDEPGVWILCVSTTVGTADGFDKDIRAILLVPVEETFPPEPSLSGIESSINALEDRVDSLENIITSYTPETNLAIAAIAVGIVAIVVAGTAVIISRKR